MDENLRIIDRLREAAERLDKLGDNDYRAAAYRRAAQSIERSPLALHALFDTHGISGLRSLPGVGPGIAAAIAEMLATGRWRRLERLRRPRRAPGEEQVIMYADDDGVEHECVVVKQAPDLHQTWR
jgi:DNA polymerase/3'-5' exonuclease PolX